MYGGGFNQQQPQQRHPADQSGPSLMGGMYGGGFNQQQPQQQQQSYNPYAQPMMGGMQQFNMQAMY
jgi:hypothetical protein